VLYIKSQRTYLKNIFIPNLERLFIRVTSFVNLRSLSYKESSFFLYIYTKHSVWRRCHGIVAVKAAYKLTDMGQRCHLFNLRSSVVHHQHLVWSFLFLFQGRQLWGLAVVLQLFVRHDKIHPHLPPCIVPINKNIICFHLLLHTNHTCVLSPCPSQRIIILQPGIQLYGVV